MYTMSVTDVGKVVDFKQIKKIHASTSASFIETCGANQIKDKFLHVHVDKMLLYYCT
jgi:hypothetical protein